MTDMRRQLKNALELTERANKDADNKKTENAKKVEHYNRAGESLTGVDRPASAFSPMPEDSLQSGYDQTLDRYLEPRQSTHVRYVMSE